MKVVLAEKPSVARDIAKVLKATHSKEGYIEGNGYRITWAYGHLVELAGAKTYVENPWNLKTLPIVPERYQLQVKKEASILKQYKVIKSLFEGASLIVNATDAGREGELIFRYLYETSGVPVSTPVKRLWISSMTEEAIVKGFNNLMEGRLKDDLYNAAKARSRCDWLIGINATIALTKILDINKVTSLGRVQTPTYCLVTQRYLEHRDHIKKAYFKINLNLFKTIDFIASYEEDFESESKALAIFNNDFPNNVICKEAVKKEIRQKPPLPFDLTSLQRKANQKFKFSSKKTLDIAQGLYEKKLITYPRTDSRYLTEDLFDPVRKTIVRISGYYDLAKLFEDITISKYCINDKKVSDHHAIIPTGTIAASLNEDQQKVYDLVSKQFLTAFHLPCLKETTVYTFAHHNLVFVSKGTVIIFPGWTAILNEDQKEEQPLPEVSEGDVVKCKNVDIKKLYTQPKPLLTEASLLSLMQNCGKDFDSEDELPAELKNKGIGTPATRAAIIETIIRTNYIKREKNKLVPTEFGLQLYPVIKDLKLADVALTGNWEAALYKVEKGKLDYSIFMEQNEKFLRKRLLPDIFSIREKSAEIKKGVFLSCPKCKQHTVTSSPKAYFCKNNTCDFGMPRKISNKTLNDNQFKQLVESNKLLLTKVVSTKNKDKTYDLILSFDKDFKLIFNFPQKKPASREIDLRCPNCDAPLKETAKTYMCSKNIFDDPDSCKFNVFKIISGRKVSLQELEDLVKNHKTKWLKGFISKNKKKFEAMLVLFKEDQNYKVKLVFKSKKSAM